MSKNENEFRKAQRKTRDVSRFLKKTFDESAAKKTILEKTKNASVRVTDSYKKSGADNIVKPTALAVKTAWKGSKKTVKKADEAIGISDKAISFKEKTSENIIRPVQDYAEDRGVTDKVRILSTGVKKSYGDVRHLIKPYFAPEDAHEFLTNTKVELTKITACILQVSQKDAENWMGRFGKVVTAKIAGVAGTATLFGLVSTYGTAGTGTAIASLHGAAATNATVAALGFGGGMATGALVLSGFGLAVGFAAYKLLFSSSPRGFETLTDEEKQILNTCGLLVAAIDEKLNENPIEVYSDEALQFGTALEKLHKHLEKNTDSICSNLNQKNEIKYRQHILKDFKPKVLDGLKSFSSKVDISSAGIVAGVFYSLLTRTALDGSVEQDLVLEALRRSKIELHDATEEELSEYLNGLSPEQLQGVANNVKGIYHELLWVVEYNDTHTDTYAELHGSTNHAGSDVVIKSSDTDEILHEYQLKATNNKAYVAEHQEKYAEIDVLPTNEVAEQMGVESSGISIDTINNCVETVTNNVANNMKTDRMVESAELAGLAAAGLEAIKLMDGKTTLEQAGEQTVRTAANAAAATGITAFLFG